MVDISSQNNKINVNVSSAGNKVSTNITPDYAQYYSEKSKEWAISNRIVDNTDYSSKYYANESKKQADISTAKATEVVESGNMALSNITTAKNNAITSITNQETTSKTVLIDEGATQIGLIQNEGATQVDTIKKTGFYVQDGDLYCLDAEGKPKKLDTISDYSINNVHSFGDSKYVPTKVNNLSWLKSEGQQNPKGSYLDVYNWILENINNGVEGFKRSTETYTDYDYVINTTDETFRLPLLNGSENLPSNTVVSRADNTVINAGETKTLFTASHNGNISIKVFSTTGGNTITVFRNNVFVGGAGFPNNAYNQSTISFDVKRGDVVVVNLDQGTATYNYLYSKAVGNGSLYYYVGETAQNANLIDAGRLGEELVDVKASIDGDWTYKQLHFASSVSIPINTEGTGNVFTYDLSNYLPNDGYKYEVTISVEVNNSSFCTLGYYLPDNSWYCFAKGGNPSGGCFTAIVDSSRQVKISVVNMQEGIMWAHAAAYRRLGKKV